MPRIKHHRSSRRAPPPKDSDFDHEISLVDHSPSPRTSGEEGESARAPSAAGPSSEPHQEPPGTSDAVNRAGNGEGAASRDENEHKKSSSAAANRPSVQIEGKRWTRRGNRYGSC